MPITTSSPCVVDIADISLTDLASAGGKNASLGELFRSLKPKRVGVLDGFATTADAYRCLLETDQLGDRLRAIFSPFDAATVAHLFDERNEAARQLLEQSITAAKRMKKPIGICSQAPSDYPEFAAWLVEDGIDSISVNPDVAIATTLGVAAAKSEIPAEVTW